jgi:hypothetical protein
MRDLQEMGHDRDATNLAEHNHECDRLVSDVGTERQHDVWSGAA